MKNFLLALPLMILSGIAYGQIRTEHFPRGNGKETIVMLPKEFKNLKTRILQSIDLGQILDEDKLYTGEARSFRFGKGFDLAIKVEKEDWEKSNNGRIWPLYHQRMPDNQYNIIL